MPFTIHKEAPKVKLVTMGQADKEIEDELRDTPGELSTSTGDDGARTEAGDKPDSGGGGDQEGTGEQERPGRSQGKPKAENRRDQEGGGKEVAAGEA